MPSNKLLGTYLNDHLAGATAGVELAEKLSSEYASTTHGSFLSELARDIKQDHVTLEGVIDRLGIEKDPIKDTAGWVMEKISRIKLSDTLTGDADLKRLLEFETLSIGIEGKRLMWRALKEVSDDYAELAAADLDGLVKRAESQRATLEEHRQQVVKGALGS